MAIAAQAAPRTVASQGRATVSGAVYDSVGREPLRAARVQFFGTAGSGDGRMFSATTDSAGIYRLDSLPPGDYLAGFFHPAIDSLGIELSPRAVHVAVGRQRVDLGSPSPRQLSALLCDGTLADSSALVIGHVRSADSEEPITGASVMFEWTEMSFDRATGAKSIERSATARTKAAGWFALCGVPAGAPLLVRAFFGGDTTGYVPHESESRGLSHLTFLIGHNVRVAVRDSSAPDSTPNITMLRGTSRLHGRVVNGTGEPVANAHVDVAGTGLAATTNNAGTYVIDSLPSGTHTAIIRAIGFEPLERVVQLPTARDATADFRFAERAVMLAPTMVRATMVYSRKLQLFEAHRKRSVGGIFLRPGAGTAAQTWELPTYVQQAPNTRVRFVQGQWIVSMRQRRGECVPSLWLNGSRFTFGGFDGLATFVRPEEILGVEIYPRALGMPADFTAPLSECGAIAVWTQPQPPKKAPERPHAQ